MPESGQKSTNGNANDFVQSIYFEIKSNVCCLFRMVVFIFVNNNIMKKINTTQRVGLFIKPNFKKLYD